MEPTLYMNSTPIKQAQALKTENRQKEYDFIVDLLTEIAHKYPQVRLTLAPRLNLEGRYPLEIYVILNDPEDLSGMTPLIHIDKLPNEGDNKAMVEDLKALKEVWKILIESKE